MMGHHEGARVRREAHPRHQVAREARFLIVALHVAREPGLVAGPEIAQAQRRHAVVARGVDEPAPIGARRRPEGAAQLLRAREHFPRLAIVHRDVPAELRLVVAAGAGARGDVHVAAVLRERGTHVVVRVRRHAGLRWPARPFRHLDAVPAVPVVQEEIVDGRELRRIARHHDVLAVGRPLGGDELRLLRLRERARIAPVRVDDPEVVRSAPIAHEDDLLAVGRPARRDVEAHPTRQARGRAAGDRQRVEVAHEIEHDRAAVGGDVERHPRPLVGGEAHVARGLERQLAALPRIGGGGLGGEGRREKRGREREDDRAESVLAHGRSGTEGRRCVRTVS